jgi:hypothetical protein
MLPTRLAILLAAVGALLALSSAVPTTPLGIDTASAEVTKSRDTGAGGGGGASGNISRVGDRTGTLISGWAVPVMMALAGIFILGALARREVGAAVAVVLITIAASFFLLTPDAARSAIEGISRFILG